MNAPVTLDQLQATISRALDVAPDDRSRIEKAAALIALGCVELLDAETFSVRSQTDAGVTYRVSPGGCECIDHQRHPLARCKHAWAARILVAAMLDAESQSAPAPAAEDARALVARLSQERAARGRALHVAGVRPVDDDVWVEMGQRIERLRATLPPATFRRAA